MTYLQALECDYVSANLHKWIDLIFGYKQKGEEALANHNVFHHYFYEGAVDIDKIDDPMKRNAVISFIHNFGQMPKQVHACTSVLMNKPQLSTNFTKCKSKGTSYSEC